MKECQEDAVHTNDINRVCRFEKPPRIALIDYHKGNIRSVEKAFVSAGCDVVVADSPSVLDNADAVVLPGVGAFRDASDTLVELELLKPLHDFIESNGVFLGICLGMHLMYSSGIEHSQKGSPAPGIGVIDGTVMRLPDRDDEGIQYKIPHVGWNSIELSRGKWSSEPVLSNRQDGEYFYFTHSYMAPNSPCSIAFSTHSVTFPCAARYKNAFGVQFHPEKSSDAGMQVIKNFAAFAAEQA